MISVNVQRIRKAEAFKREGESSPFAVIKIAPKEGLGTVNIFLDNPGEAWLLLDAAQDAVDLLQERES